MSCCPTPTTSAATKVHIHLHLDDLAAGIAFYRAFLGSEPVKQHPGYAKFLPTWTPLNLALSQQRTQASRGSVVSHLGIQVPTPAELLHQLERVRATGLPVRVEMAVDCCHANQDKFWVSDPAGVEWEVYHLNHDLVEQPAAAESCCAGGGCGA